MARRQPQPDEQTGDEPKPITAPGANVTDDTIIEFYNKAVTAKSAADKAQAEAKTKNGEYRAVLKSAKKAGIPPEIIAWRLQQREQDPADIDRDTAWKNRIARLTNLPIGTQLGMFDDGTTVAAHVDASSAIARQNGIITNADLAEAMDEGEKAGLEGHGPEANKYEHASPLGMRWEKGRQEGASALAKQQAGGRDPDQLEQEGYLAHQGKEAPVAPYTGPAAAHHWLNGWHKRNREMIGTDEYVAPPEPAATTELPLPK